MNEQLEKELKKYKRVIVLSIFGAIFSIAFVVYYLLQNDNRFLMWLAILGLDLFELQKDLKRYKALKK